MLRAIAIYEYNNEDESFKSIDVAVKPGTLFFPNNALSDFEQTTLPKLQENGRLMSGDKMFDDKCGEEFYYLQWIPERTHLLVVISERELFEMEPHYLLINVNHVDVRSERVRTTLNDILRNPLGYTGRDLITHSLLEDVGELKALAINTKNLVMERGERVETLAEKSERLYVSSVEFQNRAEELKNSFSCCGGVRNSIKTATDKLRIVK